MWFVSFPLVLGPPCSFCLALTVLLFLLRIVLSPRSVGRFPLLVFLTLRPIEVILSVAVRRLGPLITHGVPGELIQIYGDWASDAYKAYLEFSVESKLAFAQQLRFAFLSSAS